MRLCFLILLTAFVVDGNWQTDPAAAETADDGLGGKNSVKVVNP